MQDLKWFVLYDNGQVLLQIEPDGKKNAYEDIDRKRLTHFFLYGKDLNRPVFCASFTDDGDKLIWRRRTQKVPGMEDLTVHIVGKRHQYVAMVSSDNVQIFDNFDESIAILAHPELLLQEE